MGTLRDGTALSVRWGTLVGVNSRFVARLSHDVNTDSAASATLGW